MQKKEVYILTGTIHSGKSSTLAKWCNTRNDVFGILSPVENDKRFFQDISNGEKFPMEAGRLNCQEEVLMKFSKKYYKHHLLT